MYKLLRLTNGRKGRTSEAFVQALFFLPNKLQLHRGKLRLLYASHRRLEAAPLFALYFLSHARENGSRKTRVLKDGAEDRHDGRSDLASSRSPPKNDQKGVSSGSTNPKNGASRIKGLVRTQHGQGIARPSTERFLVDAFA